MENKRINVFVIAFWVLVIFAIFSIFNIIKTNIYRMDIKDSQSVLEEASINFIFKKRLNLDKNFMVCFNGVCKNLQSDIFHNVYYLKYNPQYYDSDFYRNKADKIYFAYDKKYSNLIKDNLDEIYLYVGNRDFNYTKDDIKNFKTASFEIKFDGLNGNKKYDALILPSDFKTNYKGALNHVLTLFLNFFYNWRVFIIPYFWLFVAFCIYAYNKDKFNFKLNNKLFYSLLGSVFIVAILLRCNLLMYNPFWYDEIYTKSVASGSFLDCFKDPGNPPLFFILEYLTYKIFPLDIALRLVPMVIGVCFVPMVYLLFKNINKNLALFASFFAAINTIFIYHSKEIRSGVFCALLIVCIIYILFKYLNKPKTKNLILYTVLTICAINTHYYLAVFSFSNFIWGIVDLAQNKNLKNKKNEIIKFTFANIIACLTFVPYLILSFQKALTPNFNSWIGVFDKYKFLYTINEFFINKYVFLFLSLIVLINLIFIYLPKNILNKLNLKINPKKENLYIYLIYSIVLILIAVSLISIFIKPIFHKRIVLSIYSLIMLIEILSISSVFEFENLKKLPLIIKGFYSTLLFFICMSITHPMPVNKIYKIDDYMNFILADSKKYIEKGYEIHGFLIDNKKALKQFPKIKKMNIVWHVINKENTSSFIQKIKKEDYVSENKKAVLYLNTLGVDFDSVMMLNPDAYIIQTNSIPNGKIIYK